MEQQYETKFIFKYWSNIKNDVIDFFYVIINCTVLAIAVTIIGPIRSFLVNFVASQSFGITVTSIVFWSLMIIRPRTWELLLFIVVIDVCCAVLIGLQICIFILQYFFNIVLDLQANALGLQMIIGGLLFSFFGVYFFLTKIRLKYRNEMIDKEKTRRTDMEKENLSANLKVLQAQIEPHFLFNTLSNILSLIDTKPDTGKSMLLDLTKYLRTSLSRTLPEKTTLSQEISMIKAYLDIHKIRMDERLNYKIDVPDNLWQHSFPPMLLQPLVENTIKHGLEPKVEGGEIVIRAIQENDLLKIEVADTGLGFSDLDKPGLGITNVRERLSLLFGDKGRLIIEENKPHGVRATIEVPVSEL
ncbi:Autolysin sensor kinase [Smithella sp. ME-1]|nr:Autolysin sensor kinase [Smithella sp. ME-1]